MLLLGAHAKKFIFEIIVHTFSYFGGHFHEKSLIWTLITLAHQDCHYFGRQMLAFKNVSSDIKLLKKFCRQSV